MCQLMYFLQEMSNCADNPRLSIRIFIWGCNQIREKDASNLFVGDLKWNQKSKWRLRSLPFVSCLIIKETHCFYALDIDSDLSSWIHMLDMISMPHCHIVHRWMQIIAFNKATNIDGDGWLHTYFIYTDKSTFCCSSWCNQRYVCELQCIKNKLAWTVKIIWCIFVRGINTVSYFKKLIPRCGDWEFWRKK